MASDIETNEDFRIRGGRSGVLVLVTVVGGGGGGSFGRLPEL